MTGERQWTGTGHMVEVPGPVDRVPPFDARSGDHLWVVVAGFRVDPKRMEDPDVTPMLDGENLLTVQGPGCYYCEQRYTPLLASRRCRGEGA